MRNKITLSLLLLIVFFQINASPVAITNNFFIKDTYVEKDLTVKYSGVVKFNTSSKDNYVSDIVFNTYLASFYIEEVSYKGVQYRGHDIFGHTFPKEILAKLNIKAVVTYKETSIQFVGDISSFKKEKLFLSKSQIKELKSQTSSARQEFERGIGFRLKLLKTNSLDFPIKKDIVPEIINSIKINKQKKSTEQKEKEYSRLLTEGNLLLNENNYRASLVSYSLAKTYTQDPTFVNAKIDIVDSYLTKDRSKYRWINRAEDKAISLKQEKIKQTRINFETDFVSNEDKKVFSDIEAEANQLLVKNEYEKAIEKFNEAKNYTTNKKAIEEKIKVVERFQDKADKIAGINVKERKKSNKKRQKELKKQTNDINKTKDLISKSTGTKPTASDNTTINYPKVEIDETLSYADLLKKGSESLSKREYIKSKAYFEAAKTKTTNKESVDQILVSVNKLAKSEAISKGYTQTNNQVQATTVAIIDNTNTPTTIAKKNNSETSDLTVKAEVLKAQFGEEDNRRGFIKYKRDEQAIVDSYDRIMIPYGKYEILRFRAGFAKIKMKDPVELKTIECTGENDEYSWSARIYQNPWIETTIDKKGSYVEELVKRVEIYVVDNVSLLPWELVPQSIKDAYKDPNQFTGTDFISAFNLWERENAKKPEVVARRKEIQAFKNASKGEAYRGANKCKQQVAQSIEEVYEYYRKMGYEIVVKY